MLAEIENEEIQAIPQEKYDLLVWTPREILFRSRPKLRNKVLAETVVPFTIALQVKLRRSVFGTYIHEFNQNQRQDEFINMNKLTITESTVKNFNRRQTDTFDYNSNIFDDILKYLTKTITETKQIDCEYLYKHATHLRLDDYQINMVDEGIGNFKHLQVLVLCGNWIGDIDGEVLPRSLKVLELYLNEITSVANLANKIPKRLSHLGLGRNRLTNDSAFHLLGEVRRLGNLKSLDLSESDIYDLVEVLTSLKRLQGLESLNLQGNPCSMVMGYKDIVLHYFPYLIFLDGIEISKPDRILANNFMDGSRKAEMILNCVKLTGLPKPPKVDKKIKQGFHAEFSMPLFEESTEEEVRGEYKDTKVKTTQKRDSKSLYERPNEYDKNKINKSFKTPRESWSNQMRFDGAVVKSPEKNLYAYRDSFRSCVKVRIVYTEYIPPVKVKKKGKGEKKGKKNKKEKSSSKKSDKKKDKGKRSKQKGNKSDDTADDKKKIVEEAIEEKEEVLTEITLASFYCDLLPAGWKESLQFYWSEGPEFGEKAVEMETYLERLRKAEEAKTEKQGKLEEKAKLAKGNNKKRTNKDSKQTEKKSKKTEKMKASKAKTDAHLVTCQVSFEMARHRAEIKKIESAVTTAKKKKKKK